MIGVGIHKALLWKKLLSI